MAISGIWLLMELAMLFQYTTVRRFCTLQVLKAVKIYLFLRMIKWFCYTLEGDFSVDSHFML